MLDSLIVLSFNKLATTRHCLTALVERSLLEGKTELIVVDNGSTDGSAEWLDAALPQLAAAAGMTCQIVHNSENVGCSTARNQALELAQGTSITFLDNDVYPATRNWLTRLRARLLGSGRTGMAGAKMIYPAPPHLIQCAGVGISKRGRVCFRGRGEPRDDPRWSSATRVQALISATLMVRRDLIEQHGGFDEAFNPVQFEDFDLCYRLREAGWEAWYEPTVEMYHDESTTTQGSPSIHNAAVVIRNGLRFQKRWRHMFEHEEGPSDEECRWRNL